MHDRPADPGGMRRFVSPGGTKRFWLFVRFGIVGGLTAAIYTTVLLLTVEVAGQTPAVGAAVAFVLAIIFNYLAQYGWAFRSDISHITTGPRYIVVIVVIFSANVLATKFLPHWFHLNYLIVQGGVALFAILASFGFQTCWVFRGERKGPRSRRRT